ncbi:MAG: PrsW family intramembrane metalloprotease [Candidatus Pacebacteria bacterium]|nr:PrsW family intramembrane metalloprotease [Candidatus Paceibacterota bacterium]
MALTLFLASLCGILPIALWLIFFLWQDIKKPEPLQWIGILFLLGMAITPFIWFVENYFIDLLQINIHAVLPFFLSAFIYLVVAGIEELAKFFSAVLFLRKNKYFDEAIDAMIYLIVLGLGFGVVENILISYQEISSGGYFLPTFQIITLRFIGANLLHALCCGLIGFFWALKLVTGKNRYLGIGLILGILLHWVFNIAIINLGGDAVFLVSLILFLVGIVVLWAFDILKQIKKPIKIN